MTWNLSFIRLPWAIRKWIVLLRDKKRKVDTASQLIGDELDFNAESVALYEQGEKAMQDLRGELLFIAWEEHRADFLVLGNNRPGLVKEVREDYAALQRTIAQGATPPQSVHLKTLAWQLHEIDY
jgi:hypothetical protein